MVRRSFLVLASLGMLSGWQTGPLLCYNGERAAVPLPPRSRRHSRSPHTNGRLPRRIGPGICCGKAIGRWARGTS